MEIDILYERHGSLYGRDRIIWLLPHLDGDPSVILDLIQGSGGRGMIRLGCSEAAQLRLGDMEMSQHVTASMNSVLYRVSGKQRAAGVEMQALSLIHI